MKKQLTLISFFIIFIISASYSYGVLITNVNTGTTYGLNCTLEDFEQGLNSNWSNSSGQIFDIDETGADKSMKYSIPEPAQTTICFSLPETYQDMPQKRLLSFKIKAELPKALFRIGLKEKSGEVWYSKKFRPINTSFETVSYQLYQFLYEPDSNRLIDNKIDLSQIEKIIFYISSTTQNSIFLDQIVVHGQLPIASLENKHLAMNNNSNNKIKVSAFSGTDITAPVITELLIDEKEVLENDFVNSEPKITALISETGSGLATWNISIIDAKSDTIKANYTENSLGVTGSMITVSYNAASLDDGEYLVRIEAYDSLGLSSSAQTPTFNVVSEFKITDTLNGPNPFNPNNEVTNIQYQLTKDADVDIYIYSISGERLWHRAFFEGMPGGVCGFNSAPWNGINDFGEVVANGPYIAYLIAKKDGKTVSAKIKMLVLK
jgi:hypothetical protein